MEATQDHLVYLDNLRASGVVNMFGAGVYLQDNFELERREASAVLKEWMSSFGERHPNG